MDYKGLASDFAMVQTLLSAVGVLAPRERSGQGVFTGIGYYVVAAILVGTIGICFLLAGLYMYLATIMQPFEVCLIMGAVISGLGLAILASRAFVFYMFQRKLRKTIKGFYKDIKDVLEDVSAQAEKPIIENPKLGLVIALLAGFLLAKKLLKD